MNAVARAFDAWGVQLVGMDKTSGALMFSHDGGDASPESALDYIRTYHDQNPRVPASLALGPDDWLHDHEYFDAAFIENHPFYRDFLIPYGGRYLSATKIVDDDERLIVLAVMRGNRQLPFNAEERVDLERLKRHLRAALSIQANLRATTAELQTGADLLNQFDRPMILIDGERRIRYRNDAAGRTLDAGDYVHDRSGSLHCRDRDADRSLSVALYELRLTDNLVKSWDLPDRRFLTTRSMPDRIAIGLYLVALRPEATLGRFGAASRALVFFHDPRATTALDPMIVAETFGLTPAEARVAVGLADGLCAEQIAERHGVSVLTVRAQIRSALAKTSLSRQVDLVRALVKMPEFGLAEVSARGADSQN